MLEDMRTAGKPIRLILLKARQWGGSTLVQIYMAWIQLVHCRNWNSVICAHLKESAANIKGMYSKLLANYPDWLLDGEKPKFKPFERMANTSVIAGRGVQGNHRLGRESGIGAGYRRGDGSPLGGGFLAEQPHEIARTGDALDMRVDHAATLFDGGYGKHGERDGVLFSPRVRTSQTGREPTNSSLSSRGSK